MTDTPTIFDPNQRGLWAPKPGPSYLNDMPPVKSAHLTVKMNVPEHLIFSDTIPSRMELDRICAFALREAVRNLRSAYAQEAQVAYDPGPHQPAPIAAPPGAPVPTASTTNYDECLACQ